MADTMEKITSHKSKRRPSAATGSDSNIQAGDSELLGGYIVRISSLGQLLTDWTAMLGYKQELRRHYSTIQIFAVAFSIMGLLPSIASTLSFSMPAGPVGMVWVMIIRAEISGFVANWLYRVCRYTFDCV
jgi:hypothetical protein